MSSTKSGGYWLRAGKQHAAQKLRGATRTASKQRAAPLS
jgi:hypothetical protein